DGESPGGGRPEKDCEDEGWVAHPSNQCPAGRGVKGRMQKAGARKGARRDWEGRRPGPLPHEALLPHLPRLPLAADHGHAGHGPEPESEEGKGGWLRNGRSGQFADFDDRQVPLAYDPIVAEDVVIEKAVENR